MKKGFTLTEMIAVIGIIALMSLMIVPKIINQVNEKKGEMSESMEQMIFAAADLYFNQNVNIYKKNIGVTYCVKISQLVESDYLEAPLKDINTGKEIDLSKGVQVVVDEYNQYNNYEIRSSC